jgi:hypothetical protein
MISGNNGKNGNNGINPNNRNSLFANLKILQKRIKNGKKVLYIKSEYPDKNSNLIIEQNKISKIYIDEYSIHIQTQKSGFFNISKNLFPNLKIVGNNIINYKYKNENEYFIKI